jgi:hypothetical protein
MMKVRIGNPTVQPENKDWLFAEAKRTRRSVPDIIDMLIEHARNRSLDLSSGQARETAEAMGREP